MIINANSCPEVTNWATDGPRCSHCSAALCRARIAACSARLQEQPQQIALQLTVPRCKLPAPSTHPLLQHQGRSLALTLRRHHIADAVPAKLRSPRIGVMAPSHAARRRHGSRPSVDGRIRTPPLETPVALAFYHVTVRGDACAFGGIGNCNRCRHDHVSLPHPLLQGWNRSSREASGASARLYQ